MLTGKLLIYIATADPLALAWREWGIIKYGEFSPGYWALFLNGFLPDDSTIQAHWPQLHPDGR